MAQPLSAERFVILLKSESQYRCLFSLQFERVKGELGYFVHLPYFAHAQGLVKKAMLTSKPGESEQVDLTIGGSTTSQRIKFTHHPDGEAHFSQDNKVLTSIRNKTPRLRDYRGHLFTFQFWGAEGFIRARSKDLKPPNSSRTSVFFDWADHLAPADVAARIVAHRYSVRQTAVSPMMPKDVDYSRPVTFQKSDGSRDSGILLFPPDFRSDDFFIAMSYRSSERSRSSIASSLVFHGGYSTPITALTPSSAISALMVFYADREDEWQNLVTRLGTIDFMTASETISPG